MKQSSKLESGKTYTLREIFSNDFMIAIPDLQRDYCWGLETFDKKGNQQGELVTKFMTSLKGKWEESAADGHHTPMGLIYGYEWPKGTYQLCDGQQRITTFYLLAGELHKNEFVSDDAKNALKEILIRHQYGIDSAEIAPALVYSIRETTLYFLSDLVKHYFLGEDALHFNTLEDRKNTHMALHPLGRPSWYFLEYDVDPSIQSMLAAIFSIRRFLEKFDDKESLSSFAKAVASQFSFIYYDMGNRMRGEETFVVLNTSGEPLTPTENLKPMLLGGLLLKETDPNFKAEISNQWEEREDWFWKHKSGREFTSDDLSKDFYSWWIQIDRNKEDVNLFKDYSYLRDPISDIRSIHSLFQSLTEVIHWIHSSSDAQAILMALSKWNHDFGWNRKLLDCRTELSIMSWLREPAHREILLPLIAFHDKFQGHGLLNMLRRLAKNYFIGKTTKGENDPEHLRPYLKIRDVINLIGQSENDTYVLNSPSWYNKDEQNKDLIFKDQTEALIKLEIDETLRFDFNVLWMAGASSIGEAKAMKKRLHTLHKLASGHAENGNAEEISMSNHYRLLKFLLRWGAPSGKQRYVHWRQWGVMFNNDKYLDNLYSSYKDTRLWNLLAAENLRETLEYCLFDTISGKEHLMDFFTDTSPYLPAGIMRSPEDVMRIWLISKFLVNEFAFDTKYLISKYDEYSLCVNKEAAADNLIDKTLPASMGNLCLHHVKKNGPWTIEEEYYYNPACLDSPLFVGILNIDYHTFKKGQVTPQDIDTTTLRIKDLMKDFLSKHKAAIPR